MAESSGRAMRVMSIMAHQDDFEFNAGGTFALLRQTYGDGVDLRILATTRGASGHHEMSIEETFRRRDAEARASAAVIGAEYECLTCLDGSHLHGQLFIDRNVCGGLWNAIRRYEPDVVFCPPVASDPLAGIHIDHENTARAIRMVAYQLIVPNAFPTMDGPVKKRFRQPVIINVDDGYSAEGLFHIRQDITDAYDKKCQMSLCHESQVFEWLPWTRGHEQPLTRQQWEEHFEARHQRTNARYEQTDGKLSEYFRVTRWARKPEAGELERIFPKMLVNQYEG